jgi:hypothetical protein
MWYKNEININIDGLEAFLSLFESTEDFYKHLFTSIKFFKQEDVKLQSMSMLKSIHENKKLPVRFTMKSKNLFHIPTDSNQRNFNKKTFKNRKEAHDFADKRNLVHTKTGINVCIDKDGNYYVKREIYKATGYKVSAGAKSHMFNYVISHVWGQTSDPLYFSSLWNIVLIPNYLSYILDKPDAINPITHKIKTLVKAACFELYKPNELMNREVVEDSDKLKDDRDVFRKLIAHNKIAINYIEAINE